MNAQNRHWFGGRKERHQTDGTGCHCGECMDEKRKATKSDCMDVVSQDYKKCRNPENQKNIIKTINVNDSYSMSLQRRLLCIIGIAMVKAAQSTLRSFNQIWCFKLIDLGRFGSIGNPLDMFEGFGNTMDSIGNPLDVVDKIDSAIDDAKDKVRLNQSYQSGCFPVLTCTLWIYLWSTCQGFHGDRYVLFQA